MAESVESELEVMKPLRKPGHQEQEQAEHYRSHSETGQRYRQMIPIELFKFIFLHVISLISTETGSRSSLAHDPSAQNTVQFLEVLANSSEPSSENRARSETHHGPKTGGGPYGGIYGPYGP